MTGSFWLSPAVHQVVNSWAGDDPNQPVKESRFGTSMKGPCATSLLILTFIFGSNSAFGDDCSIAQIHDQYDPEQAMLDAQAAAKDGQFRFIGVADGIGPSRPGFEGVQLTKCLMLDAEWEMLWVGADSTFCKNGNIL